MDDGRYDMLLRGGRVICPVSGIDGIRDVAIRDGRIAAVYTMRNPEKLARVTA